MFAPEDVKDWRYLMELKVKFFSQDSGKIIEKTFDSAYKCRLFVNKIRHSKRCILISFPNLG